MNSGGNTNLLVLLYRLAHRQQENFTTEALAHVFRYLARHQWSVAARVFQWLTELPYFETRASGDGLVIRTQDRTEQHGTPDLRIAADDLDVLVEVKLDGNLTFEQADHYAKELERRGRPNRKLVALLGAAPQDPLPDGTVVRTWGQLGETLSKEVARCPSDVSLHLADELVGLLRHLHLMPLRVCSPLSAALQAHAAWSDAHPDQPSVTRTRLRSLSRLESFPETRPLLELLSQMRAVLSAATLRKESGVRSYAFDSGPKMPEPWIGFNVNDMEYFFYVPLTTPEHVVLQRYRHPVDARRFDGTLGTLEPAAPNGVVRWRDTLDLLDEDGAFFGETEVDQAKRLDAFFTRAFEFGERLAPRPVTREPVADQDVREQPLQCADG
jgi:hypothetical protein